MADKKIPWLGEFDDLYIPNAQLIQPGSPGAPPIQPPDWTPQVEEPEGWRYLRPKEAIALKMIGFAAPDLVPVGYVVPEKKSASIKPPPQPLPEPVGGFRRPPPPPPKAPMPSKLPPPPKPLPPLKAQTKGGIPIPSVDEARATFGLPPTQPRKRPVAAPIAFDFTPPKRAPARPIVIEKSAPPQPQGFSTRPAKGSQEARDKMAAMRAKRKYHQRSEPPQEPLDEDTDNGPDDDSAEE